MINGSKPSWYIYPMFSLNGATHEHSSQNLAMGFAILNLDLSTSNIEVLVYEKTQQRNEFLITQNE